MFQCAKFETETNKLYEDGQADRRRCLNQNFEINVKASFWVLQNF